MKLPQAAVRFVPGDEAEKLKAQVAADVVDHLIASKGELATPGDPVAKVRREVLRGLTRPEKRRPGP